MSFEDRQNRTHHRRKTDWMRRGAAHLALFAAVGFATAVIFGLVHQ
ncbi:MAG: hypothetical protein WBA44_10430 [Mesorhizobium sp.]